MAVSEQAESTIVTKCTLVMDILCNAREPMIFSEIVAKTGFVKSSCHRILGVLQGEGLVDYDKPTRRYRIGSRLHYWARSAWRRIDLQQVACSVMEHLAESCSMNVALSVLDEDTILYLRTFDVAPVRYGSHSGDHAPLHCTAAGKVFLANLSSQRFQNILGKLRLEKFTERTKTDLAELISEFSRIREQGFATAVDEEFLQVTGIAAPIFNAQGEVTACLSLWALTEQVTAQEVIAQSGRIIASAADISGKLGWTAALV